MPGTHFSAKCSRWYFGESFLRTSQISVLLGNVGFPFSRILSDVCSDLCFRLSRLDEMGLLSQLLSRHWQSSDSCEVDLLEVGADTRPQHPRGPGDADTFSFKFGALFSELRHFCIG